MTERVDYCPECNSIMTYGWISAKSFLHWYDNPKPVRTLFGFGTPLFNTNPCIHRFGKQEAKRCSNCGLVIFKSELNVKKTFYKNPFALQVSIFAGVFLTLIAGIVYLRITMPQSLPVPEQAKVMSCVSPIIGFRYLSGYYDNSHNLPAMYAHGYNVEPQLTIVGRGVEQHFPMRQSNSAFQTYRELLIENGYSPE